MGKTWKEINFVFIILFIVVILCKEGSTLNATIIVASGNNPLIENTELILNCSYPSRLLNQTVKWFFSNDVVTNQETTSEQFIKTVTRADAGEYTCGIYENNQTLVAISQRLRIDVYYIDKPTLRFLPNTVEEGVNFAFLCEVSSSNPRTWTRTFLKNNAVTQVDSIVLATSALKGFYQCQASNGQVTKLSDEVYLDVKSTMNVTLTSSTENYIVGVPFKLKCLASTVKGSIDNYGWKKNGVDLNNNANTLDVMPLLADNGASYSCSARATDTDGYSLTKESNKAIISLSLGTSISPVKTEVEVGQMYALTCSIPRIQANMIITYTWYRNGQLMPGYESQPVIAFEAQAEEEDTTIEYECMATITQSNINAKSGKASVIVKEKYVEWKSSLVIGLTVGTVIGGICLVIVLVLLLIWCCCLKHQTVQETVVSEKKEEPQKTKVKRTSSKFSNISSKTVRLNYTSQLSDGHSVSFAPNIRNETAIPIEEESEPEDDDDKTYEELSVKNDVCMMPTKKPFPDFHMVSDNEFEKEKTSRADSNHSDLSFKPIPGAMPNFQPPELSDTDAYNTETDNEIYHEKLENKRSVTFNDTDCLISESDSQSPSEKEIYPIERAPQAAVPDVPEIDEGDYIDSDNEELRQVKLNIIGKKTDSDHEQLIKPDNVPKIINNDFYSSESSSDEESDFYGDVSELNNPNLKKPPPKHALPDLPLTDLSDYHSDQENVAPPPKMSLPKLPSIVINSDDEMEKSHENNNNLPNGGIVNRSFESES